MKEPGNDGQDYSNFTDNETFEKVMQRRFSRRTLLKGAAAAAPLLVLGGGAVPGSLQTASAAAPLGFTPINANKDDKVTVPAGYTASYLIGWGDPLFAGVDKLGQGASGWNNPGGLQEVRFGYNADFIGYYPLPDYASGNSASGLLVVNHEYTDAELMFYGWSVATQTEAQVETQIAAHGVAVVEVARSGGKWSYKQSSPYNRRITGETPITITGPAAGHDWLKTSGEPTGTKVNGTLNNCAAGKTPWGTVLTCEENFNQYFANRSMMSSSDPRTAIHARYGLPTGTDRGWEMYYSRFDLSKEPNEAFRFGWVVEFDPYNPNSTPKKRTAIGRMKHEAATTVVAANGQVVVYTGDDERFDYMYKFVSAGQYVPGNRAANMDLLDNGTLYVAKFYDNGTGAWLPLIHGQGPLTQANGFANQGSVMINTRGAADLLGATKMDRPEDIETSPVTGKVYAVMTNNSNRTAAQIDKANPRANNRYGHIIEMTELAGNHAGLSFSWEILMLAGDPAASDTYFAGFDKSKVTQISSPDNIVFGAGGNLWIATDGQPGSISTNDALYAMPVDGSDRGHLRRFLTVPPEAETCGPEFTPDFETLFVAVQHPGEQTGSTIENPASKWPDNASPPRPSVVAITKNGGGVIGS
jgi:secreted PhoX family phosphatase